MHLVRNTWLWWQVLSVRLSLWQIIFHHPHTSVFFIVQPCLALRWKPRKSALSSALTGLYKVTFMCVWFSAGLVCSACCCQRWTGGRCLNACGPLLKGPVKSVQCQIVAFTHVVSLLDLKVKCVISDPLTSPTILQNNVCFQRSFPNNPPVLPLVVALPQTHANGWANDAVSQCFPCTTVFKLFCNVFQEFVCFFCYVFLAHGTFTDFVFNVEFSFIHYSLCIIQ